VYTSDNEYDFVTLPTDMRFKFPFDNSAQIAQKWAEFFDWVNLPNDWQETSHGNIVRTMHYSGKGHVEGAPTFDAGVYRQKGAAREQERAKMSDEINTLLNRRQGQSQETDEDLLAMQRNKRSRMAKMPDLVSSGDESERRGGQENISSNIEERRDLNKKQSVNIGGLTKGNQYASG
jgi:WD domain, G-beta repeat